MNKLVVMPTWLSVLSLAVALFVPLGVGLIADSSADIGNRSNVLPTEYGRFVPPDQWLMVPVEPASYRTGQKSSGEVREAGNFDHRV
jgi:hypothetical protein